MLDENINNLGFSIILLNVLLVSNLGFWLFFGLMSFEDIISLVLCLFL